MSKQEPWLKEILNSIGPNQPLKCEVDPNFHILTISIGVSTLAWAALEKNGGPLNSSIKVVDSRIFAQDVANELERQDEIGNTMINDMLDKAIVKAVDQGSVGVDYPPNY